MASILGKDPYSYQKESRSFLQDLRRFHDCRGTHIRAIPRIAGKEVDLYLLYSQVTALGGWAKVNDEAKWEEIQENFTIPRGCTNGGQALKQIYIRYLSLFEKVHFFGEDPHQQQEYEDEESRASRKKANSYLQTVPQYYNWRQHMVPDALRSSAGMSTTFAAHSGYDKLEKSLLSGLPNEVDFAINVCTLLSNEGKHIMKLDKSRHLLDNMMANVGIYADGPGSLIELHDHWKNVTGRNFVQFWLETIRDKDMAELIAPSGVYEETMNTKEEEEDILNLGRELGIKDVEGQRVLQMASIIRNLSFEIENMAVLAAHPLVFRFLLLCSHSRYSCLKQLGLDTLGNIAVEMTLAPISEWTTQLMLVTICKFLDSSDKFEVVRSMEILSKLCQVDANEDVIAEHLSERAYKSIADKLTILDIQLIVHTLEVLYQLSELGELTTNEIAQVQSCVDMLVQLVTIEAQSYGQNALIGIKVVEHAPAPESVRISSQPQPPQFMPHRQVQFPAINHENVNERFASNWLRATFDSHPSSTIPRVQLYSAYLNICNSNSITDVISTSDFTRCVRNVFPRSECVKVDKPTGTAEMHFKGVKRRLVPLPMPQKGLIRQPMMSSQQPIMGSYHNMPHVPSPRPPMAYPVVQSPSPQMTPPMSPGPPIRVPLPTTPVPPQQVSNTDVRSVLQQQLNSPPQMRQVKVLPYGNGPLKQQAQSPPPQSLQQGTKADSNLIKSLLANKVTQNMQMARLQNNQQPSNMMRPPMATSAVGPTPLVTSQSPVKTQATPLNNGPSTTQQGKPLNQYSQLTNCESGPNHLSRTSQPQQQPAQQQQQLQSKDSRKRKTTSPTVSPSRSKSPIGCNGKPAKSACLTTQPGTPQSNHLTPPMSPRNCQLEVCGDVERAQDIVRGTENVHEATIERIENQCANQYSNTPSQVTAVSSQSGHTPLVQNSQAPPCVNNSNPPVTPCDSIQNDLSVNKDAQKQSEPTKMEISMTDTDSIDRAPPSVCSEQSVNSTSNNAVLNHNNKYLDDTSRDSDSTIINGSLSDVMSQPSPLVQDDTMTRCPEATDIVTKIEEKKEFIQQMLDSHTTKTERTVLNGLIHHMENGDYRKQEKTQMDHLDETIARVLEESTAVSPVASNGPIFANGYLSDSTKDSDSLIDGNRLRTNGDVHSECLGDDSNSVNLQDKMELDSDVCMQSSPSTNHLEDQSQNNIDNNILNQDESSKGSLSVEISDPNLSSLPTLNSSTLSPIGQPQVARSKNIPTKAGDQTPKTTSSLLPGDKGKKKKSRSRTSSVDSRRSSTHSQAGTSTTPATSSSSNSNTTTTAPQVVEYMCEWQGCKKCFDNLKDVFPHVFSRHLKYYQEGFCLWDCCDQLKRAKYSLITHVQDRHCTEAAMKAAGVRRQGGSSSQSGAPNPPMPPPVYPADAAIQAIKRFTAKPPYQEFVDPKEGPVTKHIRLTSALILRNLARYSSHGRSLIKRYEHHLAQVALSSLEASTAITNCLWELHQHH